MIEPTLALQDRICECIMNGKSFREIERLEGMPSSSTILRWLNFLPDFADKYARARIVQADVMDSKILDLATDCTEENYQSTKVKMAAYTWRAAKLNAKRYGDKVQHEHSGGATLTLTLPESVAQRLQERIEAKAQPQVIEGEID